jgi:hypothetical protein
MSHVTLETPFTIPEGVVSREIEGETVLLNLESGRYFGLNAVGTRVWQLLGDLGRPQPVVEALLREFDVAPAALESDVLALLEQLAAHGLVATPDPGR